MKPVIGITVNYDFANVIGAQTGLGTPLQDWDYVALDYANAVCASGGIPVLIPNCKNPEDMLPILDRIDGLLLSGGADINPALYGDTIKGWCGPIQVRRDAQELVMLKGAFEKKMPILGICRGAQFMNVGFGGTMYQDLPKEKGIYHSIGVSSRNHPVHTVKFSGGLIRDIMGVDEIGTNSYHHQALKDIAPNGSVTGLSADGNVEAVEFSGGHPFTLGVQWHPEMMYDSPYTKKLFDAFIAAAAE
ncbi:MAG: gamma-glutamyl-gamma-aminobutyrate hydrolase family protein [Solobacterium sp.]|nr:gamma-glutamyl-gamma-aminobutyrate hydrolase family protein [Solobacterium sp.]